MLKIDKVSNLEKDLDKYSSRKLSRNKNLGWNSNIRLNPYLNKTKRKLHINKPNRYLNTE